MTFGEKILKLGKLLADATAGADQGDELAPFYGELATHVESLIVAETEAHDLRQLQYNASRQGNARSLFRCESELKRCYREIDELRTAVKQVQQEIATGGW